MPEVINAQADENGDFPIRLFGTDYVVHPVKTKKAVTANKNRRTSAQAKQENVGQPLNDTPEQDPNNPDNIES